MIAFIQAKNCGPDRKGQPIRLIVVHTMEAKEKPHTAKNVALWFAGKDAPIASAHYCIDADETVQCVKEDMVAWAAPGANRDGIHLEHAGYANQGPMGWADDYSERMLRRSAALAADIAKRYGIPVRRLSAEELETDALATGFCGHVDVTRGRAHGHGHTDPGPDFPWGMYLEMVTDAVEGTDPGSGPRPDEA